MLEKKYSGVNDGKPYPVDMVAFKDGDSVSNLKVENGELKLNDNPVGGGSGGSGGNKVIVTFSDNTDDGSWVSDKSVTDIYNELGDRGVENVEVNIHSSDGYTHIPINYQLTPSRLLIYYIENTVSNLDAVCYLSTLTLSRFDDYSVTNKREHSWTATQVQS